MVQLDRAARLPSGFRAIGWRSRYGAGGSKSPFLQASWLARTSYYSINVPGTAGVQFHDIRMTGGYHPRTIACCAEVSKLDLPGRLTITYANCLDAKRDRLGQSISGVLERSGDRSRPNALARHGHPVDSGRNVASRLGSGGVFPDARQPQGRAYRTQGHGARRGQQADPRLLSVGPDFDDRHALLAQRASVRPGEIL